MDRAKRYPLAHANWYLMQMLKEKGAAIEILAGQGIQITTNRYEIFPEDANQVNYDAIIELTISDGWHRGTAHVSQELRFLAPGGWTNANTFMFYDIGDD